MIPKTNPHPQRATFGRKECIHWAVDPRQVEIPGPGRGALSFAQPGLPRGGFLAQSAGNLALRSRPYFPAKPYLSVAAPAQVAFTQAKRGNCDLDNRW